MPELPEVETVRRGIEPILIGNTIVKAELRRKDLRIPFPENMQQAVEGAQINAVRRRSKYLLVDLTCEQGGNINLTLLIHLGMSGKVLVKGSAYQPEKHDHVLLHLKDGAVLVYNDARRFGLMTLCPTAELEQHELIAHLGPEPFSNHFNETYLYETLSKRNSPIKHVLMDAKMVVGIGNIYASEILFRTHLHPLRKANSIARKHMPALHQNIREVLQEAIDSGGSTLRDYVRSDGGLGYFQHRFAVYGRENNPCTTCATPIERIQQQGRSTFFCPRCQRR